MLSRMLQRIFFPLCKTQRLGWAQFNGHRQKLISVDPFFNEFFTPCLKFYNLLHNIVRCDEFFFSKFSFCVILNLHFFVPTQF